MLTTRAVRQGLAASVPAFQVPPCSSKAPLVDSCSLAADFLHYPVRQGSIAPHAWPAAILGALNTIVERIQTPLPCVFGRSFVMSVAKMPVQRRRYQAISWTRAFSSSNPTV